MATVAQTLLVDYAVLWVVILTHEGGHLAAALALGLPVIGLDLGNGGDRVWSFSRRGVRINIGVLPFTGAVKMAWPSKRRWKNAAVTLAGPLANLATSAALFQFAERGTVLHGLALMSLIVGLYNLVPIKSRNTDGAQLLAEWRRARDGVLTR